MQSQTHHAVKIHPHTRLSICLAEGKYKNQQSSNSLDRSCNKIVSSLSLITNTTTTTQPPPPNKEKHQKLTNRASHAARPAPSA